MGDNAFQMAFDCVSELRTQNRLPAYFHYRDEARKREEERLAAQREQRWAFYQQYGVEPPAWAHVKKVLHVEDQYAVLIAAPAFKDIDTARKALDALRKLKPPSDRLLHQQFVAPDVAKPNQSEMRRAAENPFLSAFVVPNPAAPKLKANPAEERKEEFSLRDWNAGETLSAVHKIPGKWTLVVKSYRGASRFVSQSQERSTVERGSQGGRQGNLSEANARSAHQLAEILRNPQLNFESYALHMPGMSIVTVGAFDNKDDVRMTAVITQIGKLHLNIQGGVASSEPLEPPIPYLIPRK